ncbi:MAG: hypothetical protein GYA42_09850 [Syntrophomonadaceae bacterium]|nr:hypothetical protein [Syntrophomonadaceae bacterium]
MDLPALINQINTLQLEVSKNFIMESNQVSEGFGLQLTPAGAEEIINARNGHLLELGRVDTDLGIVKKIILTFCSSSYVDNSSFVGTVNDLVHTFYFCKNHSHDLIGDDDLIALMQFYFNGSCGGSVELLRERELSAFIRIFLRAYHENASGREEMNAI